MEAPRSRPQLLHNPFSTNQRQRHCLFYIDEYLKAGSDIDRGSPTLLTINRWTSVIAVIVECTRVRGYFDGQRRILIWSLSVIANVWFGRMVKENSGKEWISMDFNPLLVNQCNVNACFIVPVMSVKWLITHPCAKFKFYKTLRIFFFRFFIKFLKISRIRFDGYMQFI